MQFSMLNFPYEKAVTAFMTRFRDIYQHLYGKDMPFSLWPSYRQLNDALLALAPGLIQGFETIYDGDERNRRMLAFTRFEGGRAEDFPTLNQLTGLIRHWLQRWGEQDDVQTIILNDGQQAWQLLMYALDHAPETEWVHGISPADIAANPGRDGSLGYVALPALLSALLHDRTMTIHGAGRAYDLTWRRVNDGGKNGLHVVSQPIQYREDYFAYRLDFSVQTQAGTADSSGNLRTWIFARLSIQRYIDEAYKSDGFEKRRSAISILVGRNHEQFSGGWDDSTALIRLPVKYGKGGEIRWDSGVGHLLDDFGMRQLPKPELILSSPRNHAAYDWLPPKGDECYIVYAEGRAFGDGKKPRSHRVKTGTSLRERNQIMQGVLTLLDGWLVSSLPFRLDAQNPKNTLALRDYDYMVASLDIGAKKRTAWLAALQASLAASGRERLQIVVLYRSQEFREWLNTQFTEALMGIETGENPLARVDFVPLPPMLYAPLDSGDLDPELYFEKANKKPKDFHARWQQQMRDGYAKKREEWRTFLRDLGWENGARRLLLIDSTGEAAVKIDSQKIKGAIRDACHREGVSSQFLVGATLHLLEKGKTAGQLSGESKGRIKNAVLDLLLRQQAILYAPPHEIYARAANLDAKLAETLDVIAFCRVQRKVPFKLYYPVAVRLRANGEVSVFLPNDSLGWLSYEAARHKLGGIFSDERAKLSHPKSASRLRLGNGDLLDFAHHVLTTQLERPTIAVIEAEGWRNGRGGDEQKYCWTQLRNGDLSRQRDELHFDRNRSYKRQSPALERLLGVVRIRKNDETPQYVTSGEWAPEDILRDIPHLTAYIDEERTTLLHYMSVAQLAEPQKDQKGKNVVEAFKGDEKSRYEDMAYKHPQLIELVPFFIHPDHQSEEETARLCRCIHFLRNSPGFTMGDITLPYPMHLGQKMIDDLLCIVGADK